MLWKNKEVIYLSVLFIVVSVVIIFISPIEFLINFSHDDSYYYIETAFNFSNGLGSTFDGVSTTNGYHPLWFIFLVIIFKLISPLEIQNPDLLFRLIFLIHVVFSFFIVINLWKSFSNWKLNGIRIFKFFSLLFLLSAFVFIRDVGMESIIYCYIFSLFILLKSKESNNIHFPIITKIILITLLVLTRTDTAFTIVPALIIADLVTNNISLRKNKLFYLYLIFPFFVYFIYGMFNYYSFGYFQNVSSLYVNSFPDIVFIENLKRLFNDAAILNQLPKLILIIFVSIFILINYYKRIISFDNPLIILSFLALGSLIFLIIHLLFNNFGIREWYQTIPMFICSIFIILVFDKFNRYNRLLFFVALIVFLFAFIWTRVINLKYNDIYEYSRELKNKTNSEQMIFAFDWMGIIGFFSERNVISGDGFANSYQYKNYLDRGNLRKYFQDYEIDYYSTHINGKSLLKNNYFVDSVRIRQFNVEPFKIPIENLTYKEEFEYEHATGPIQGYYLLFKL